MEASVSFLPQVAALAKLPLHSGSPNLAPPSQAVSYTMSSIEDTDFKDRTAFQSGQFTEETKNLESLAELLARGRSFCNMLYTYRSCARAIPMVQGDTADEVRIDVHLKTFSVLRPQILKLKEFRQFQEEVIDIVRNNVMVSSL